jgi:hypothetical protein
MVWLRLRRATQLKTTDGLIRQGDFVLACDARGVPFMWVDNDTGVAIGAGQVVSAFLAAAEPTTLADRPAAG